MRVRFRVVFGFHDGDGVCMVCKQKAADGETLTCKTCVTPWHAICLTTPLQTLADAAQWERPDCSNTSAVVKPAAGCGGGGLVEKIRAIECDESMTDKEKAKRRQELMSGGVTEAHEEDKKKTKKNNVAVLDILGDKFNCSICMNLLGRPVYVELINRCRDLGLGYGTKLHRRVMYWDKIMGSNE